MRSVACWLALLLVCALAAPVHGQIPLIGKRKDKEEKAAPPKASEQPPEYSEKDKAKLEELAQKIEVKEAIEAEWQDAKREDMEVAYAINTRDMMRVSGRAAREGEAFQRVLKFGGVYDNPILQDYVNTLGQSLVPKDSPNLYAFKLVLNPVPRAESLTTGTIYVSTGLVALLDNEAQLAYVLAHEVAHVEKMHRFQEIRNRVLENALIAEKEKDVAKKRAILKWASLGAGGLIGGAVSGTSFGAGEGAMIGGIGGLVAGQILFRQNLRPTAWSVLNENEADEMGVKLALQRNYDVREIPKAYARLDSLVQRDDRIGLGFMGNKARVRERIAHIRSLLDGVVKADLETKAKTGLTASSPNFSLLMAALKRDNAVIALDYDLFPMAKDNLEDALAIRSNDPRSQYYFGKVLALTGRTPAERQEALSHFLKAIQYDAERGSYPEPHLQQALSLIRENNTAQRDKVIEELKTFVTLYQREHGGQLPPNMHIIYDYFLLAGENSWYVPPVSNVSTKNVDAIQVVTTATTATMTPALAPAATPVSGRPKR